MNLVLIELIVLQLLASTIFEAFESETPALKKILKWVIIDAVTVGFYYVIGYWTVLIPLVPIIFGGLYHFTWCKKNGIDPWKATPRKKYYELRGWKWIE